MVTGNLVVNNASIGFKNFSGRPGDFNAAGARNFCVFFDMQMAQQLEADGWKIKYTRPSEEWEQKGFMKVNIMFGKYPPKVGLASKAAGLEMIVDETQLDRFDGFEFDNIDLVIRPYNYPAKGNRPGGVTAYVQEAVFVLKESDLMNKYANYGQSPVPTPEGDLPF